MQRYVKLAVLLGVFFSAPGFATETSMCKSICSAEKRQCHANAIHTTGMDGRSPLFEMQDSGHAKAMARIQNTPAELKADQRSDARKRQSERDSACESAALTCSRACFTPAPAKASEILLKPQTQQ